MTARPEPVEAYRLCDLPVGTKYMEGDAGPHTVPPCGYAGDASLVEVVEWPKPRTYDGIPADELDALVSRMKSALMPYGWDALDRIRAAIEAQEQAR